MCDVVFVGFCDNDFDGVILKALRLMDRHGVSHLEGHGGVQRVVVLVAGVVFVDGESHGRVTHPF